jgi:hypothetical protein
VVAESGLDIVRGFESVKAGYKGRIIEILIVKEIVIRHMWTEDLSVTKSFTSKSTISHEHDAEPFDRWKQVKLVCFQERIRPI